MTAPMRSPESVKTPWTLGSVLKAGSVAVSGAFLVGGFAFNNLPSAVAGGIVISAVGLNELRLSGK